MRPFLNKPQDSHVPKSVFHSRHRIKWEAQEGVRILLILTDNREREVIVKGTVQGSAKREGPDLRFAFDVERPERILYHSVVHVPIASCKRRVVSVQGKQIQSINTGKEADNKWEGLRGGPKSQAENIAIAGQIAMDHRSAQLILADTWTHVIVVLHERLHGMGFASTTETSRLASPNAVPGLSSVRNC